MTGKFIVLEGIDLSGKSTIAQMLVNWLNDNGIKSILTRHPGSTQIGQELRKIIKESTATIDKNTEALILAADNSAFINQVLKPSLEAGIWVVCDRNNFISSMAYQTASGCSLEQLDKVHSATADKPPKIDLLLIFQISSDTHSQRAAVRGKSGRDNFEDRGNDYLNKVMAAYDKILTNHRILKFVKKMEIYKYVFTASGMYINANRTIDEVFSTCCDLIKPLIEDCHN